MKVYRLAAAAGLVLATAAACGSPDPPTLSAAGVSRRQPAAGAPVDAVARGITALGYQLATSALPAGKNSVTSPLSIAYAFAMARAGAGGATARQIDQFFGFPPSGLHDAFNALTRQVVTADAPPAKARATTRPAGPPQPPVVCVGNALFPQQGYPIGQQFLHTLAAQYGTGVHPVDFGSGKALGIIDDWARQQTAGRIKKVFDQLSRDTRLVLANTIYLRADWAHPFEEGTAPQPFTRADHSTVQVPTMRGQARLRYAAGSGWQAVELPYAGGQLAMRVLLPPAGQAPGRLLAPASMAAVAAALQPADVGVALPKWDFASNLDLKQALTSLGLTEPFDLNADFSGINPELHIAQAVHRANITVDEWGTEAAAVTGLSFDLALPAPPKIQMTVDRPFAFAIVHAATGIPLFMGQVADPTAK
ncbi:MAG: hypothetical protein V7603_5804 [Micromonosporaceae bacterium]